MRNTRNTRAALLRISIAALAMIALGWLVADRVALLRVERSLSADAERIVAAVCNSEDPDLTLEAARLRGGGRVAWIKVASEGSSAFRIVKTDQGRVAVAARAIGGKRFVEVAVYLDTRVNRARRTVLI
ncbi:MAG: hypothetical protein FJW38_31915 [Acidobacteria bacterium]|nr:hypothetical protein [Acidobacteriota bacterium]